MREDFGQVQPGDRPSADQENALRHAVGRLDNTPGGLNPGYFGHAVHAPLPRHDQPNAFWARLTTQPTATEGYSWVQVLDNGDGSYPDAAGGMQGGPGHYPAYASDGSITVPAAAAAGSGSSVVRLIWNDYVSGFTFVNFSSIEGVSIAAVVGVSPDTGVIWDATLQTISIPGAGQPPKLRVGQSVWLWAFMGMNLTTAYNYAVFPTGLSNSYLPFGSAGGSGSGSGTRQSRQIYGVIGGWLKQVICINTNPVDISY